VAPEGEAVDRERVGQQVKVLSGMLDRMGSPQPERVVERPVDRLGVIASPVEPLELRVGRGDLTDVLGAVEFPLTVIGVAVEPDGDRSAAVAVGEPVGVVPAETGASDLRVG